MSEAEERPAPEPDGPGTESPKERVDRELNELLGELRVALPGVQVLFAFLLIVPFTDRFAELNGFERGAYFTTLACAALATALLIAPSAYHRLRFRDPNKLQMLIDWNRLAITGLAFLALAMTGAILLISTLLFDPPLPALIAAVTFVGFVSIWYLMPLRRRL